MASFNLVDEGWIPCAMHNGDSRELGLREVMVQSHDIREIFDPCPLVTVALHRLLLAILHHNFGPASLDRWKLLWMKGAWDRSIIVNYLEEYRGRFDLFDGARPFYQPAPDDDAKQHPVALLAFEMATGNNATLFDHSFNEEPAAMSPQWAARHIVARQAFSIGFGKSNPFYFADAPLTRGFTVLALGDNLFETLALNLVQYNEERPFSHNGMDLPVWAQVNPAVPASEGTFALGYLDYLTWQSRRLRLIPEGDPPRISYCQLQQNLKLDGELLDPFKSFRKDEKRGYIPRSLDSERALWRDSHSLFGGFDGGPIAGGSTRPDVFNWLARVELLRRSGYIAAKPTYRFDVFGFATEPGKAASVILWRHERLPLPLAFLEDKELVDRLRLGLSLAEDAARVLASGAATLARLALAPDSDRPGARQPQRESVAEMARNLRPERSYWPRLEAPFRELLLGLAGSGEERASEQVLSHWALAISRAATAAFEGTADGMGFTSRVLKAAAVAESMFRAKLRDVLREYLP